MVNIPLPRGSRQRGISRGGARALAAGARAHRPQMIFVSAGFDAHREDPLAGLEFADADYAWVTRELVAVAATACAGSHRVDARRRLRAVRARPQRGRARARARRRVIGSAIDCAADAGASLRGAGVERRKFLGIVRSRCPAPSALAGVAGVGARRRRASTSARGSSTSTARRSARALVAETNYVFQYPFAATPCFLLKLGRPAVAEATLRREDGRRTRGSGGVGPSAGDRRVLGDLRAQARLSDARRLVHPLPARALGDVRRAA